MRPLTTPIGILITVALLALYGAYGIWTAIVEVSWMPVGAAAVAVVACVGIATLRPWSRFLVYVLTLAFVGTWTYSIYSAAAVGYFSLFSAREIGLSLAPGLLLILVSCFCAYVVFKHFRARNAVVVTKPET
jgi:hypothetical protein